MLNEVPASTWRTQLEGAFPCKYKILLLDNLCSSEILIPSHTHFASPLQNREKKKAIKFVSNI